MADFPIHLFYINTLGSTRLARRLECHMIYDIFVYSYSHVHVNRFWEIIVTFSFFFKFKFLLYFFYFWDYVSYPYYACEIRCKDGLNLLCWKKPRTNVMNSSCLQMVANVQQSRGHRGHRSRRRSGHEQTTMCLWRCYAKGWSHEPRTSTSTIQSW